MTTIANTELGSVARTLSGVTTEAFELVDRIQAEAVADLDLDRPRRRADLSGTSDLVLAALARPGALVQGAGVVLEHRALADAEWWLEWFAVDAEGRPQRLQISTDPGGVSSYEYEHLPWFAGPRATGQRHLTGPYVDYLCTEDYTLTFTAPVLVGSSFLGVAGADVGVSELERRLLPALRAADTRLAVVNAHGRILASNRGRDTCGELIDDLPSLKEHWGRDDRDPVTLVVIDDLPLAVVALDRLG
ncbi:cache domain-containing protein [Nocardioides sp.]|uniref:cache domain-containing protein n=1 Tax=Nocardioides sp. TaxID=35761 RepID=UPI002C72B981|nr:cache domain-containing protein [Nocardioides sp.]HSX68345.1 cache domain-containing protein [Nocardioides sp.]